MNSQIISQLYTFSKEGYLLHGSNCPHLNEIRPNKANCNTHANGNLNAVYASDDCHLAIYYAILDKNTWHGISKAQKLNEDGIIRYYFALDICFLSSTPFCRGYIYVMDKRGFCLVDMKNAFNNNEWYSLSPAVPLCKIEVNPSDFKFADKIDFL